MITDGIIGHELLVRLFVTWSTQPANGYLFHGASHVGKRMVAERFVSSLLGTPAEKINRAHPDLILLEPEEGKMIIASKAVREARLRCSSRPMVAPRQVVYLPFADRLNVEGANALLKVLEEPPAQAVFVLVAEDVSRLPETVHSRLVAVPFHSVPETVIVEHLVSRGIDRADAEQRAKMSCGRPGLAIEIEEGGMWSTDFPERFLRATSFGERIAIIDEMTGACEQMDDPQSAWLDCLDVWIQRLRLSLKEADSKSGRALLHTAHGVCGARRSVGTSLSPRLALEQSAVQLDMLK